MSANTFPAQIEPFKWAEQGFSWSGQLPLSSFTRIAHEAVGSIDNQWVQVDCKLSMDAYHRIVWLTAHLQASVNLQCQRCLDAVEIPLQSDVYVAMLDDESEIDHLDEDADFIILGEDLGTQKGDFKTPATVDLIYILEDELLLSMPNSPKHDACEHKHRPAVQAVIDEKRDNPFEILAGLKGKLGS
ncbi:YceD family protein [Acinetobacter puyangensis]|uniref:YceD family protein n=1 Tax=Acinetobacter puyangensis TaxID=1096779 RepID=UPI003A4E33E8